MSDNYTNAIKIICEFDGYKHLVCDEKGHFWRLPYQAGHLTMPAKKINQVMHMNSLHVNHKGERLSIAKLRDIAVLVEKTYIIKKAPKSKLPF